MFCYEGSLEARKEYINESIIADLDLLSLFRNSCVNIALLTLYA